MGVLSSWDYSTCWWTRLLWQGIFNLLEKLAENWLNILTETKGTIPIRTSTPRIFSLFHLPQHSGKYPLGWPRWGTPSSWCVGSCIHSCKYSFPLLILLLTKYQVGRGYYMHLSGDYVPNGSDFSSSKWLPTTELYIDKISNDLSSDNWTSIFCALHHLQESDAQHNRVQTGAPLVPVPHQPLLPDDPPTPPPLD